MKTSELTGAALDWAVAKCEGLRTYVEVVEGFKPSTDWAQGGSIIEREKIEWMWLPAPDKKNQYGARKPSFSGAMDGPTVLIAAMRCYVASKLGDDVELPAELLGE